MLDGEGFAWIEDTNNLTFMPSVFYFIQTLFEPTIRG